MNFLRFKLAGSMAGDLLGGKTPRSEVVSWLAIRSAGLTPIQKQAVVGGRGDLAKCKDVIGRIKRAANADTNHRSVTVVYSGGR